MPASLQAALIPLIVMALSAWATKLGLDAKDMQGNIYFLAASAAAFLAAAYQAGFTWLQTRGKERAESLVPGITKKTGPESPITTIINDPTTPAPPTVINKPLDPQP